MALKGISTQEEATSFSNELAKLSSNYAFHVNCALDKAHGIELVSGFIDNLAQDRRVYQDSFGGLVSHGNVNYPNFVRFIIGGIPYYAPCLLPPLTGGSDPGGQGTVTGVASTLAAPAGEVALATDYVLLDTEASASMSDFIFAHSRLTHQVAHTPMTVVPVKTYRSNGALLGNWRVRFAWNGSIYEIPCDTRVGGPGQVPRLLPYCPNQYTAPPGDQNGYVMDWWYQARIVGGTPPFTYTYAALTASMPVTLLPSSGIDFLIKTYLCGGDSYPTVRCNWNDSNGYFNIYDNLGTIGQDWAVVQIFLAVTNAYGSTNVDINGAPLFFQGIIVEEEP